jgi:hypothetical protein
MGIESKCLICGEQISKHGSDEKVAGLSSMYAITCLGKLHDLVINYAKFQKMLHDIGSGDAFDLAYGYENTIKFVTKENEEEKGWT